MRQHWHNRQPSTQGLADILAEQQVCVLSGPPGVGKKAMVADYARSIRVSKLARWISAENSSLVLEGFHSLALDLGLNSKSMV